MTKKRFVVGLNDAPPAQDLAFKEFLKRFESVGWWHWVSGLWLIVDIGNTFTAASLRDQVKAIYPNTRIMVLEFSQNEDTWAGFGPAGKESSMFDWMNSTWKTD